MSVLPVKNEAVQGIQYGIFYLNNLMTMRCTSGFYHNHTSVRYLL